MPQQLTKDELAEAIAGAVKTPIEALAETLTADFDAKLAELRKPEATPLVVPDDADVKVGEDAILADPKAGFANLGAFALAVARADMGKGVDERLSIAAKQYTIACKTAGVMEEGDDSQGGYLVPVEYRAQLLKNELGASVFLSRARIIPMATNTIQLPAVNETSRASNVFGGVTVYWPDEYAAKTPSKPALRLVQLTLHEMAALVHVTNALLEDSAISITPLLRDMFPAALAFTADNQILNGTGAGRPRGIVNAPCLVTVAKETGQAAASVVWENVLKMWSRLYPASHGNAVWYVNPDVFPQLATMQLTVGTGGLPVYLPAGGASDAPYSTLFSRPVIITEHCQTVGTVGDIVLADMRQYLVGQKAGAAVEFASSIHLKFDYDATSFRFVQRIDGQPWWNSPLTPEHGTNTLSPFVALAARA